ncbi:Transposase IS116/IS110/IS902 family protein [Sphingobium sp. AP50]|uniref:IS110 family transposase n=1 Tax=Sphingobium sp. AP50 TaxID=1884369 RepID=UPI0008CAB5F9|nr:IS110 family transposase [Sphingobium sp. AP50]SEJ98432.1 Transposase IS116/IS110/IS902 family protein [Sphingobium sp. AP50]
MVNPGAAAIDIGLTMHMAAISPRADDNPVRAFGTFTGELHEMARWFKASGVTSVAMESTGVYWIPAYEVLEGHGFHIILVNARYAKNLPGRKTDVSDAASLQRLHSYALLRGSFRPEAGVATMLAYLRQRERLIEYAASHIEHMQKALMEMNVQLHHVVSDITGVTGMRIIRAIVAGERKPITLAEMRDVRCHASVETICAALSGNWWDEHIFALCQSLALYDFYQTKVLECDRKLKVALKALEIDKGHDIRGLPNVRTKRRQVNTPDLEVRSALYRVLGADLTQIHGIGPSLALKLVGECGTDLAAWPSSKHFTSWLCLAPGNKISGGKLLPSKTRRSSSRPATLLRLTATTTGRSDTASRVLPAAIGACRKGEGGHGHRAQYRFPVYNSLRYGMAYHDPGATQYEERYRSV